ncbi:MAG: hypothetical protein Q4C48_07045 [Lachnospiraceae bacterium]|nr:hypothetical protein [Lachnospiraceae bacterium]
MDKWPNHVKQIVEGVLQATNPISYLKQYINDPCARDITFLLFDGKQAIGFKEISHEFCEHKYNIINLGCYEKTAVINTSILSEKQEMCLIRTEYLINLDSNIASFLPQLLKKTKIEDGFLNFLKYLKRNNLKLDLIPYALEDSLNSTGMRNNARAYECLLGFFVFERMSISELDTLPCIPNVDDYCCADNAWSKMRHTHFSERENEKRARAIYCFFMMIYIIQFENKQSPRNKTAELIEFMNDKLGIYFEFGTVLAYWYFNKSYQCIEQFFQKVQPKSKNKLKNIEGMAWDLYHLWDVPTEMVILTQNDNAVVLQGLATHDDALAKIAKLNPLTRVAFYADEAQVKYAFSISDILANDSILEPLANMKAKREHLRATVDLIQLSRDLEAKLLGMF